MNVESTGARLPAKQVFAVVSGNALEFYDFVTYAFFAAQFNAEWLTQHFGSPRVPAWYMIGALAVGLIALGFLRETAPVKTGRVDS